MNDHMIEVSRRVRDYTITERILCGLVLLLLAPTLGAIALAVKFDSPGPVFCKLRLHDANGEPISVWKFRTVFVPANAHELDRQMAGASHVTRVGRLLRDTDLDWLPQLVSIALGNSQR